MSKAIIQAISYVYLPVTHNQALSVNRVIPIARCLHILRFIFFLFCFLLRSLVICQTYYCDALRYRLRQLTGRGRYSRIADISESLILSPLLSAFSKILTICSLYFPVYLYFRSVRAVNHSLSREKHVLSILFGICTQIKFINIPIFFG